MDLCRLQEIIFSLTFMRSIASFSRLIVIRHAGVVGQCAEIAVN
jgi:hypothetical protein